MRLLITGAWRDAEKYIPQLKEQGHQIIFVQFESDELPCDPEWVEGVICNGLFLHNDAHLFSSLKYVQLTSAGMDRVPVEYFQERGITVHNARGVYSIPMAEHAVTAVLQLLRNSRFFIDNQHQHIWLKDRTLRELNGSAVTVLGCGSVGTECAKRFSAMGCKVIGVDIRSFENEYFESIYPFKDIHRAIADADIIIITLPLTEQTEGLVDREFLSQLKSGCVLVNIARGRIINTDALIEALNSRELSAALDVFDEEPLDENSPLWAMENVMITPHNSFVSDKTGNRLSGLIMKNLKQF